MCFRNRCTGHPDLPPIIPDLLGYGEAQPGASCFRLSRIDLPERLEIGSQILALMRFRIDHPDEMRSLPHRRRSGRCLLRELDGRCLADSGGLAPRAGIAAATARRSRLKSQLDPFCVGRRRGFASLFYDGRISRFPRDLLVRLDLGMSRTSLDQREEVLELAPHMFNCFFCSSFSVPPARENVPVKRNGIQRRARFMRIVRGRGLQLVGRFALPLLRRVRRGRGGVPLPF